MKPVTVRGITDRDLAALREEAATTGRSLSSILREVVAEHVEREQRRRALAEALPEMRRYQDQLRERHGGDFSDSTHLIRADRDR